MADRVEHDEDVVDGGLGVDAYRVARTRAEESVVRAAFADLDSRVRAEVVPPPARAITDRARRRQVVTARRRVGLAAAAAAVLLGGAAVAQTGFGRDGTTEVAVQTPTPSRTTVPTTPAVLPATSNPPFEATSTAPTKRTRTVVVTVPAQGSTTSRTTPARTRTATKTTRTTPAGPTAEVTVYLWQGTLYPTCTTQYSVKRTVSGTGGWTAAVTAAVAGTTSQERKDGYVSPFGPDVRFTVDEATHTVNFESTSGFADVPPACRVSLESLVTRTGADAGYGVTVKLRGSALLWANWKAGLL